MPDTSTDRKKKRREGVPDTSKGSEGGLFAPRRRHYSDYQAIAAELLRQRGELQIDWEGLNVEGGGVDETDVYIETTVSNLEESKPEAEPRRQQVATYARYFEQRLSSSKDGFISLAAEAYIDYISDVAGSSISDIAQHALEPSFVDVVFETVLDDIFLVPFVDFLLGRTGTDRLSADPESILQLQERLKEILTDSKFKKRHGENQRGFMEGFLECQRTASNKATALKDKITTTVKDVLRKGVIGFFVNTIAFPLGIGPIVQAVLGRFIDWFLGLYETRAWQEWVAKTPEEKDQMEYRLGYAEGQARCSRELLKLLNERQTGVRSAS